MFKLNKKFKMLEFRVAELEKMLKRMEHYSDAQEQADYKEVLDEWLNGKKS